MTDRELMRMACSALKRAEVFMPARAARQILEPSLVMLAHRLAQHDEQADVAELEHENRLLRARNERLEALLREQGVQA